MTALKISCTALAAIICLSYQCIQNPDGAVNTFMIIVIDLFYERFPKTPEEYQIGTMLTKFAEAYPQFGWGIVYEIFSGMVGIFNLWAIVKLWKMLPFT